MWFIQLRPRGWSSSKIIVSWNMSRRRHDSHCHRIPAHTFRAARTSRGVFAVGAHYERIPRKWSFEARRAESGVAEVLGRGTREHWNSELVSRDAEASLRAVAERVGGQRRNALRSAGCASRLTRKREKPAGETVNWSPPRALRMPRPPRGPIYQSAHGWATLFLIPENWSEGSPQVYA